MRTILANDITQAVREACIEGCCVLPAPVVQALERAKEQERGAAKAILEQLLENARLAREAMRPCCQDTGMAVAFVELGQEVHIQGNLEAAIQAGIPAGYTEGYLRKSVVSALSRENTGDNTPGVIHLRLVEGDGFTITIAPKGFGSENMSRVYMLTPAQGVEGVLDAVVDTVVSAGACACPPCVVGVGIGGTFDKAALLAKQALLRPLDQPNDQPFYAALEEELLEKINQKGIGPQGFGGRTTALAVNICTMPTHIAGLPCAANINCHVTRHKSAEL